MVGCVFPGKSSPIMFAEGVCIVIRGVENKDNIAEETIRKKRNTNEITSIQYLHALGYMIERDICPPTFND